MADNAVGDLVSGHSTRQVICYRDRAAQRTMTAATWTAVGTLVIACATAVAAIAAWRAARDTRRTTEAQLFSHLMSEYSSPEMAKALSELMDTALGWETDPLGRSFEDMVKNWARLRQQGSHPMGDARRRVSHFYRKVTRILQGGLVTGGLRSELEELNGRDVMHEVVIPIERALAEELGSARETSYITRFEHVFPKRQAPLLGKESGAT